MTDQLTLDIQTKRRAHRTDSGTNHEVAAQAEPTASVHERKILGVLRSCGTGSATYEQIGRNERVWRAAERDGPAHDAKEHPRRFREARREL